VSTGYFASHTDGRFTLLYKTRERLNLGVEIKYSSATGSTNDYDWLQLVYSILFYLALQFKANKYIQNYN